MLTIGKLGTSRGRLEYYDAQVAAGVEDYYAGRGESPGRWRGSGARALGLGAGERVSRAAFLGLMQGRSPVDGSVLRAMGARSTVAGFDLTFSAPKSVSVLFAVADRDVSSALLAAHELAVDAALAYLEREACWTRRGRDGVERLRGEGFIGASYRHRMSRAGDPQLHTHVVVANMTRAQGRYTALEAHSIYEHKSAAGALYRAVLRAEVRERLSWVRWRSVDRGLFEIDGVPARVLKHFSQRRAEIEDRALELVGADAGGLSRERMQGIALATRRAKEYGIDGGTWREQARARAAEHGFGERELARLRTSRPNTAEAFDHAGVAARLSGVKGLTERHNTFARRHALAEIAGEFPQGATAEVLEATTSRYLQHSSVVPMEAASRGDVGYTTVGLLHCERQIVEGARRRATTGCAVLQPEVIERALTDRQPRLNADQADAIRAVTSSGSGIDTIEALAGTGKTTILAVIAAGYEAAGYRVIGTAPTARAARELRTTAGIPASTIHSLLLEVNRAGGIPVGTVLLIDEAGMAATRHTALLLGVAEHAGAKVIAVGDSGQLGSVEAGGWLGAITRHQPGPAVREVVRQRDAEEREALAALHARDANTYLAHKRGNATVHTTAIDALLEVAGEWRTAQQQHGPRNAVMIARDNYTRDQLNRAARSSLKRDGLLLEHGIFIGGREYSPGDRVIARRNDRQLDVDNGTTGTVLAIDSRSGTLTLITDAGQTRTLPHKYVAQHLQHAYALTAHGAQAGTFTWAGVIGRPEEFTNEWAYTALSRAREHTSIHVISEPSERERERDEYAPAQPTQNAQQTLNQLRRAMKHPQTEPPAIEQVRQRRLQSTNQVPHHEQDSVQLLRKPTDNWHCREAAGSIGSGAYRLGKQTSRLRSGFGPRRAVAGRARRIRPLKSGQAGGVAWSTSRPWAPVIVLNWR